MDRKRWCTKEDVQEDLAQATGQRITYFDEGVFVHGERPPPPRICGDEDAEVELESGPGEMEEVGAPAPDLLGITKMLHMVQSYGRGDRMSDPSRRSPPASREPPAALLISKPSSRSPRRDPSASRERDPILTSKLNPNVEEFTPKSNGFSVGRTECAIEECNVDPKHSVERKKSNAVRSSAGVNIDLLVRQRGGPAPARREVDRAEPALPAAGPVLLLTPDYFAKVKRRSEITESVALDLGAKDASEANRCAEDRGESSGADEPEVDEREVRASVDKVTHWLNDEPRAPRAPAPLAPAPAPAPAPRLHLGPVAFKRRQPAPPACPPRSPCPPSPAAGAYVPSAHARELGRQYAERALAEAAGASAGAGAGVGGGGLWERVQDQLRRKDAEMRRRAAPAPAPAPAPEPAPVPTTTPPEARRPTLEID